MELGEKKTKSSIIKYAVISDQIACLVNQIAKNSE